MDYLLAAETAEAATRETGGYWQLALILAAIGFLGLFARWRKARTAPPVTAREMRARDDDPNRYRDAADRAIVELLETSRSLNAEVDGKIRVLNRLVKDAEDMIVRLEKRLAEARETERSGIPSTSTTVACGDPPAGSEMDTVVLPPAPKFLSDLHECIYRLRQSGRSVAEIAKTTNLSTTEVEFIVHTFPEEN
ncbi:MAG: hypothetical protein LUE17_10905 [Planctomycetaceae bacterium]|nr:hypothetical protein [Planctomycetaceae bacterium]